MESGVPSQPSKLQHPMSGFSHGVIPPDRPLGREELKQQDTLGFLGLSAELAAIVDRLQPPNSMGIFGPWGSGKSTLMKAVKDHIDGDDKSGALTVWFDTWLYDQADGDGICFALLKCIEQVVFAKRRGLIRAFKAACRVLGTLGLVTAVVMLRFVSRGHLSVLDDWTRARHVLAGSPQRRWNDWVDATAQLRSAFQSDVERGLLAANRERLVIFLDDLDRCLPGNVVTILERLKTIFLTGEARVVFVIGADRNAIMDAIRGGYGHSQAFAERYLDKLVGLNYSLEAWPRETDFLRLLSERAKMLGVDPLPLYAQPLQDVYRRLARLGGDNPRTMGKVVTKLAIFMATQVHTLENVPNLAKDDSLGYVFQGLSQPGKWSFFGVLLTLLVLKERHPTAFSRYSAELMSALGGVRVLRSDVNATHWGAHIATLRESGLDLREAQKIGKLVLDELKIPVQAIEIVYRRADRWL